MQSCSPLLSWVPPCGDLAERKHPSLQLRHGLATCSGDATCPGRRSAAGGHQDLPAEVTMARIVITGRWPHPGSLRRESAADDERSAVAPDVPMAALILLAHECVMHF